MKKNILNICAIAALTLVSVACKKEVKETTVTNPIVKTENVISNYSINKGKASVNWKANKIVGGHNGNIQVTKGNITLNGNTISAGEFTFDIKSLVCSDIPTEDKDNAKLVGHLLNEDFFDTDKFPEATFKITKVEGESVTGNLTMKGITKPVTFTAKTVVVGESAIIVSNPFTIDRTEWNINYNSGKLFDPAKLGNYLIKDDVELNLNLTATKI